MSIEIERRYLVTGNSWKRNVKSIKTIHQAYLSSEKEGWTSRIRIEDGNKALICLKSSSNGITNNEFEYEISLTDGEKILELSDKKIYKTRYSLNLKNGDWIVDCFHKENYPLVIAEVELSSESQVIKKPQWCEEEITGKYQLSNASLAKIPISIWPIKRRLSDCIPPKEHSIL